MDLGQHFRDSGEYELLEPYADNNGLVAGYRVEGLLARDAWRHTTYEAITSDGRRVALKLLPLRSGDSRRERKLFQHRVQLRASIEHPHLLPIFEWGKLDDRYYLAMGLCRAPTLADLFEAGTLDTRDGLRLLGQLADTLETTHERGLIHRELAPENILITERGGGHVMLDDFGAANPEWAGGLLDLAEPTYYVSPEKVRDEPLTPVSNVYSLACILVECLTGSPPYTSELPGMVAYAHAAEPPPRLSQRRSELPAAIDDLVAAAMEKDPEQRLESPRRLVAAAAAALRVDDPAPMVHGARQRSGSNGASANSTSGNGGLAAPTEATLEPPAKSSGVKRPPFDSSMSAAGPLTAPRRAAAWKVALPSSALRLSVAVVLAGSGALGFMVARSGDDGSRIGRGAEVDPVRLLAQRELTAALRATTDAALERLNTRRVRARRRLAVARTPDAQAAAAAPLVRAYGSASRAVPTESADAAETASTLNEVGHAYNGLVRAARRHDRRGYAVAGRTVRRSEEDLQRAIARLSEARR